MHSISWTNRLFEPMRTQAKTGEYRTDTNWNQYAVVPNDSGQKTEATPLVNANGYAEMKKALNNVIHNRDATVLFFALSLVGKHTLLVIFQ